MVLLLQLLLPSKIGGDIIKYFGTDGIRGYIDKNINSQIAYNVGKAIAYDIVNNNYPKCVLIGKDTRTSGDLLSYSLASGLIDYGIDVHIIGIISTGGVSYLTSILKVGYGVMITASHNPPDMNGIKIMDRLGYKINADICSRLEEYMDKDIPTSFQKGKLYFSNDYVKLYENALKSIVHDINGYNIVIDTSFGSMGEIAPKVLKSLGANVICIHTDIDKGHIVNSQCGALYPQKLREEVLFHKCDIGIGFDGDADRLVIVLNDGTILSGDEFLYVMAKFLNSHNKLNAKCVVGTIMTNMGLEKSLAKYDIKLIRTPVGDTNVIEEIRNNNLSLGGESSGHICLPKLNTTCDAFMNALYLLKIQKENDIKGFLIDFVKYPQLLKSFPVSERTKKVIREDCFVKYIENMSNQYDIRIVVRPSGTENLLRVMVEGNDNKLIDDVLKKIIKKIKKIEKDGVM